MEVTYFSYDTDSYHTQSVINLKKAALVTGLILAGYLPVE
jgi:hypothetical protein